MKSCKVAIIAFMIGLFQCQLAHAERSEPAFGNETSKPRQGSSDQGRETWMDIFRLLQAAVAESDQEMARSLALQLAAVVARKAPVEISLDVFQVVYVGDVLTTLGASEHAVAVYETALAIAETSDPNGEFLVDVVERFATSLHDNRRFGEAESFWQRAIGLRQKQIPVDILKLADDYQALARTYIGRQRASDAFPLLESSVAMIERRFGPNHRSLIGLLQNYAQAAAIVANGTGAGLERERFNEIASANYQRALALARQGGEAETHRADAIRQSLGIHLLVLGKYAEAEPLLLEALQRAETLAGATSLAALTPTSELAILMKETDRLPEAEAYAFQAVEIAALRLPGSDVEVIILNNLAALLLETSRPAKAISFARKGVTSEIARRSNETQSAFSTESDARTKDARIFEASIGAAWSVQSLGTKLSSGEKS